MLYEIEGSLLFKNSSKIEPLAIDNSTTIYFIGDLIGLVSPSLTLDSVETQNYIKNIFTEKHFQENFKKIMPCIVGPCNFIFIGENKSITFYSSFSSGGIFFCLSKTGIKFSSNESEIFKLTDNTNLDIDENELLSNMTLHTIFCRSPFKTFLNDVHRVPSAATSTIDLQTKNIVNDFSFSKEILLNKERDKLFGDILNRVLGLNIKYFGNNIILFFSGGVDSSLLLANLKQIKKDIKSIFIPYHGIRSRTTYLATFLSKILRSKFQIADMNINDEKFIQKSAMSGFGSLPGMQYIGAGNRVDYLDSKVNNINVISGQNADTLLHIDTFAPASSVIGYKRFIANKKSRKYRYIYSDSSLKNVKSFNDFKKILVHISSGLNEHEAFNSDKNDNEIKEILRNHKIKYSFEPIAQILNRKYKYEQEYNNLESDYRIFFIKIMRWYRTVQNVPTNYINLSRTSKINRFIPYTEGPLANYFINLNILPIDHYFEKRVIYKQFFILTGLYYRFLINLGFFISLPKLIIDKIQFKFYNRKSVADDYHKNIVYLRQLTKDYKKVHNIFSNQSIKTYLGELQKIIEGKNFSSVSLDKQDEIVRYAGSIYFLSNNLKN
tara:strand:+ start:21090 stop:22913 length:1824 start_codon:yes stop_codon:yes gene_type:complete